MLNKSFAIKIFFDIKINMAAEKMFARRNDPDLKKELKRLGANTEKLIFVLVESAKKSPSGKMLKPEQLFLIEAAMN